MTFKKNYYFTNEKTKIYNISISFLGFKELNFSKLDPWKMNKDNFYSQFNIATINNFFKIPLSARQISEFEAHSFGSLLNDNIRKQESVASFDDFWKKSSKDIGKKIDFIPFEKTQESIPYQNLSANKLYSIEKQKTKSFFAKQARKFISNSFMPYSHKSVFFLQKQKKEKWIRGKNVFIGTTKTNGMAGKIKKRRIFPYIFFKIRKNPWAGFITQKDISGRIHGFFHLSSSLNFVKKDSKFPVMSSYANQTFFFDGQVLFMIPRNENKFRNKSLSKTNRRIFPLLNLQHKRIPEMYCKDKELSNQLMINKSNKGGKKLKKVQRMTFLHDKLKQIQHKKISKTNPVRKPSFNDFSKKSLKDATDICERKSSISVKLREQDQKIFFSGHEFATNFINSKCYWSRIQKTNQKDFCPGLKSWTIHQKGFLQPYTTFSIWFLRQILSPERILKEKNLVNEDKIIFDNGQQSLLQKPLIKEIGNYIKQIKNRKTVLKTLIIKTDALLKPLNISNFTTSSYYNMTLEHQRQSIEINSIFHSLSKIHNRNSLSVKKIPGSGTRPHDLSGNDNLRKRVSIMSFDDFWKSSTDDLPIG